MSAAAATDFYAVLGLDKDCSDSELRNAYKKLALRWHPDRCSGKNEAKEKFQTIQEAYSVLSDPDKRLMYDIGVYNENDDDENAGMEDFLGELAEMMSKNTPTESGPESFEELQRLFVEMFQSDIDAEFGGGASGAGNGWNRGTSSSSHKRGSSAMNSGKAEFGEMDMGTGGFCYGSSNPVGDSSSKVGGSSSSSSSSSSKRRNGRKQKVSSSKHHVSSRETYDNTLVH